MRLTLRTLLAYMDDILDPADQEELGRKIESSAFATELIHRSRDAVRRLRLSAPSVTAGDSGEVHDGDDNLDANTASEYLDNTLSPDEVAEFERSCLEAGPHADMLLAEAASCHHVLTMVLGEPAEVDADLRQRLYALAEAHGAAKPQPSEPAHPAPGEQAPVIAAAAVAPVSTPAAPRGEEVDADEASAPDYILAAAKARRRTRRMAAAAVVGAMLIGGGLTWVFWPAGEVSVPTEVAQGGSNLDSYTHGLEIDQPKIVSDAATAAGASAAPGDEAPRFSGGIDSDAPAFEPAADPDVVVVESTIDEASAVDAVDIDEMDLELDAASSTEAMTVESATIDLPDADEALEVDAAAAAEVAEAGVDIAAETPAIPPPPPTDAAAPVGANVVPPAGETPSPPLAAEGAAATPAVVDSPPPVAPTTEAAASTAEPAVPGQPRQIGAYLGNNDVLLRFDPATTAWIRLPPRSALAMGDRLLSLPTFRTHVVLGDANVYLAGGAEIEIYPPGPPQGDAPAELGLRVPYGRLILNAGLKGNRFEMDLGGEVRTVSLAPSSSLAIEVRRVFVPGPATTRDPAPTEIAWYLTSGSAEWISPTAAASGAAQAVWTTVDGADSDVAAIDSMPEWVDRQPISDVERRAREMVAEALVAGEPVSLRLLELSDPADRGRRTEVFALAAKSGTYVGQFDPVVKALGDVKQRASWNEQIAALRQAVARDPATIELIHKAFDSQLGAKAADELVEMVLGFDVAAIGATRQEIQNGALLRLVRWLDDDDLTYRVLASYNVNQITGTRNLGGYRPEQTASQRRVAMKHYWDRLESGELTPKGIDVQ